MVGGHRLHQVLPEHVALTHLCSVFHKALEALPGGFVVVFPLDLEFNFLLILLSDDSVPNDVLHAEPTALFLLLFPFLDFACLFDVELFLLVLETFVNVSLLASLGDAELQLSFVFLLRLLITLISRIGLA